MRSLLWGWEGGGGGVGLHPFCFVVRLFDPPSSNFFSYLGLVLSTSRLRTHMSRNSSLKSPGPQVSRASTGNRLLPDPYPSYTPSDIRICLWTIFPDLSLANVNFVFKTRAAKYLV